MEGVGVMERVGVIDGVMEGVTEGVSEGVRDEVIVSEEVTEEVSEIEGVMEGVPDRDGVMVGVAEGGDVLEDVSEIVGEREGVRVVEDVSARAGIGAYTIATSRARRRTTLNGGNFTGKLAGVGPHLTPGRTGWPRHTNQPENSIVVVMLNSAEPST